MPHFTLSITQQGPLLIAFVGVSEARESALKANNVSVPNLVRVAALVDTGASATCLDPTILTTLGLTPTGSTLVSTPSTGNTPVQADQYDISLLVPPAGNSQVPLFLGTLPALSCGDLAPQGFQALIGRDVLSHCILIYNGNRGHFSLAF